MTPLLSDREENNKENNAFHSENVTPLLSTREGNAALLSDALRAWRDANRQRNRKEWL